MLFHTLISLFFLPLASLSIAYASTEPRLLSVQAPSTFSAYHPHNVSVTLSHPVRNPRLHIFTSPPLTLFPSFIAITNATTATLTFRLPPLPISTPQWRIAALYKNATILLQLPFNTVFRIIPPPSIASAHPSVLHPARLATVLLTGVFPPNPRVFVHSQPVLPPRLLHVSPSEIVVRVRPLRNQTQLNFLVRAPDGLNSTLFSVTVARHLIPLSAAPLHASYNYPTARYTLPSLCTNFTPVLHFDAHTLHQLQPPLYNVSYRLSTMPPALFRPLQTLVNSTMVLLPKALFSPKQNPHHVVTLLIAVSHAGRTGQTVLFMARRSSPHVFGISVFPHIHHQNPRRDAALLDASLSPLSCTATPNTTIRMVWRVNNTIVQPLSDPSAALHSVSTPVTTGLGNRLIVPVHGRFVYVVHAVLLHRSTNRVLARAIATGSSIVTRKALPFKAVLNGAASTVTLPSGTTTYPIRAHVYDQSQYGALSPSQRRFQYEWSCISVFDGAESPCTPQLFSPWLLGERTEVSNFQISTVGVEAGTRVVYTMYVWSDGIRSQRFSFTVLVVKESGVQIFPIGAKLRTASTSFVRSILTHGPLFKCFESVFVSWNQTLSDPLDFKLFREDEPRDYLANASEDLLIVHSGYWAKDDPYGRFFAISASALPPGRYTLYGAVNTTAGPGTGTSWRFVVEACPHLVVPDMPVTEGQANQTMFYASAYSLPSSNSLYAFLLQPLTDKLDGNATAVDIKAKNFTSSVCLNGCTGKSAIWFTVPRAGRYRLVVEMYDPSGSYLLASEQANTTITVEEVDVIEDESWRLSAEVLNMSVLHRDEPAFIDALFSIPKGDGSFSETALNSVFNALETIVYSPATNGLQNTHFVQACTRLLELDIFSSTGYMQRTLDIVEAALANSIHTGSPGFHIREALTEFYKAATRKLYKMSQTPRASNEKLNEMAAKTRRSAATAIPLVLSAGRACGVIDTERVELSGIVEESNGVARKKKPKYDDYRIGVSCFPGQVESLPPEPAVVRSCRRSTQDARKHDGNIYVLTSVEQNDVLKKSAESDMLSGPHVEVSLFQQTEVNGRIKLVRMNGSSSECYETRVSAYVPTNMSEQFLSFENQRVTCMNAGSISDASQQRSNHISERRKDVEMAREFELDASTGRVRAVVESELPVSLLLQVNGSKLEDCIRLKAGGSISGENGASQIVFWFMLVGILGCAAIAVIVLMWRWRVVQSGAGWGEEEIVGPYGAGGDVGAESSSDETVDLNLNLPLRFAARGETGSIGSLEYDRESSGASLLTATATHSSGSSEEITRNETCTETHCTQLYD